MENIKEACEKFYNAPTGSRDILASYRGPSWTKLEQIKGRKVYFIRFLPPNESVDHIFTPQEVKGSPPTVLRNQIHLLKARG